MIWKLAFSSMALFVALVASAVGTDWLLHQANLAWIGRYLGYVGTSLIAASFVYSLRKRRVIRRGTMKNHLRAHEMLAWGGSLCILVHGGIHLNAVLPWIALAAMLLSNVSGLTGRYLLHKVRMRSEEIEGDASLVESLMAKAMAQWRLIHMPITLIFGVLAALHILSMFMFWNW